ncbi:MAG TPA: 30S ribosomal protein S6 [Candidatus Paceibacterota bacterium]|nr:30S ribosomal protein S6 [Candidatus Paceibacterota bacterium]
MAKNQDEGVRADQALEDAAGESRVYELGFHLDPELPIEEVKKIYQTMHAFIAERSAVIAEGEPEKIQLAYTISRQEVAGRRDFDSAYFAWVVYETHTSAHAEILAAANANKYIVRFIDLITTKEIARHVVEMREIKVKTPERTEDPEAIAGAELDAALESITI